jgi:hypothetical protein
MSAVRRWSLTTKKLLASPGFFFENFNLREAYGFPLAYVLVSASVGAVVLGLVTLGASLALDSGGPTSAAVTGGVIAASAFLLSVVGFLTRVVVAHVVVAVTAEGSFARTLEAFAYPTAATMALGGVPVVGFVSPLYGYYLQYRGLGSFQGMGSGPAVVAILLANLVSGAVLVVFVFVVLPLLVALGLLAVLAGTGLA